MSDYNVDTSGRFPVKAWTKGVQVEEVASEQLVNMANMPFIHKHVAVMPDVHWGMGATIGSVIATKGAIIPTAVGSPNTRTAQPHPRQSPRIPQCLDSRGFGGQGRGVRPLEYSLVFVRRVPIWVPR